MVHQTQGCFSYCSHKVIKEYLTLQSQRSKYADVIKDLTIHKENHTYKNVNIYGSIKFKNAKLEPMFGIKLQT